MAQKGLFKEYATTLSFVIRVMDIVGVVSSGLVAYALRFNELANLWPVPYHYQLAILIGGLLAAVVFPAFRMYQSWRGKAWLQQLHTIIFAWSTVVILLIVVGFSLKYGAEFSRQWFFTWAGLGLGFVMLFRVALGQALRILRAAGRNRKRIIVIGAGELGREVARKILDSNWTGLDVVGFLDDSEKLVNAKIDGVPVLGNIAIIGKLFEKNSERIDEVWIALPLRAEVKVKAILHDLRHSTVTVRFIPDIFSFRLLNHSVSEIAGIPILDLNVTPMVGVNRLIKAVEDRVLGLFILTLISPLMVIIAIGVKISSPGPVLFKQRRHGWDGKTINVYKFRTMYLHQENDGKVTQACKNDQRITKYGAFLRHTSLDELPQFINVLQGKMSIVGPRPHAIAHNDEYKDQIDAYMQRHKVKPGITGWAQINGFRGETDTLEKMRKRVEYDHYYIENWSLWFDLKIILLTMFRGFIHKNAY